MESKCQDFPCHLGSIVSEPIKFQVGKRNCVYFLEFLFRKYGKNERTNTILEYGCTIVFS